MKRSEAVKILMHSFWNHMNSQDPEVNTDEKMYSAVLADFQKIGILPPLLPIKKFKPADYRYGTMCTMHCDCEDCNPDFLVSRWEPEDAS